MSIIAPVNKLKNLKHRGISLVEILVYISLLTLFLVSISLMTQSFTKTYRSMRSAQNIEVSASTILERLTRAIRDSLTVDMAGSVLGSSPGILVLNTLDDDGLATTTQFFLSDGVVRFKEGTVDIGPLTASSTSVTNLVFRVITTDKSKAVKTEITIESGSGESYSSKNFYSTVVLRGSYPLQ